MPRKIGKDGTYADYGIALASKMQLVLRQPQADVTTFLTNEDFQGDFFDIGDTVKIVKPDPNSVTVTVGDKNIDRPTLQELDFEAGVLKIDKSMKYAFQIGDIQDAEGRWNYESGAHDLAAQNMRIKHNINTLQMIVNNKNVLKLGTPAAPIEVTPDTLYTNVLVPSYVKLRANGAISADGTYSFGSNSEVQHRTRAAIFMPQEGTQLMLTSKWVTDRPTADADDVLRTAGYKEVLGMSIEFEPALSTTADDHVQVLNADGHTLEDMPTGVFAIVIGTNNAVTRAGKVLEPEVMRDKDKYADNYYGLEIFGEKVASPNSVVVAFCKMTAQPALPTGNAVASDNTTLNFNLQDTQTDL